MLHWLLIAARELREAQDRKPPDVGFWLGDASGVYRFEQGKGWPRDPDRMVNAYAKECNIEDARELWALALELWRAHGEAPDLNELRVDRPPLEPGDALEAARQGFERALSGPSPERREDAPRPARKSGARKTR